MSGLEKMKELVSQLPQQLVQGYGLAQGKPIRMKEGQLVLIMGMGGSGIVGEIFSCLSAQMGGYPVIGLSSGTLPLWARKGTLAIFVSYTGDTEETLSAYLEARSRGLSRAVVSSGGKLHELASEDGVTSIVVPSGNPPRASLGYLLGALLGLLGDSLGIRNEEMQRIHKELVSLGERLNRKNGWPEQVARGWGKRRLFVYVPERLSPVGRRWKTQAEENAKQLGHYDTIPEMLHNAIVPWDHGHNLQASDIFVVLITGFNDSGWMQERVGYLHQRLVEAGGNVLWVRLESNRPLTELLEGVWIGDYASLEEARALHIDPMPVPAIDKMKDHFRKG